METRTSGPPTLEPGSWREWLAAMAPALLRLLPHPNEPLQAG
jgi:hypothetical protein